MNNREWTAQCHQYYGKVLTGKYAHWCYDWDGLPIDETCEEFKCCNCFSELGINVKASVATEVDSKENDDKQSKN